MKKMQYKIRFLLIIFSLLFQQVHAQKTYQSILKQLQNPSPNQVLIAAHRGDWRNAPENSIDAIRRCIKMGVDIVEIDIHKTKDGQLVLLHDETIDRTTTGHGRLDNWTLDSLKTLRIRQGHGASIPGQLPTLEQAMLFIKGKPVLVNLDKSWDCLEEAFAVLKKTGTIQQAIFKGSETLTEMRKKHGALMDSILYMPMVRAADFPVNNETANQSVDFVSGFFDHFKPVAFEVTFDRVESPVLIKAIPAIQQHHVAVWMNSLWETQAANHTDEESLTHPDENWGWLIKKGANVIQTDRPKELMDYLREMKLHN
ncbi:MAG: glycerophosphodiester phosphodiesterase family protein [Dyadobacter sp.]